MVKYVTKLSKDRVIFTSVDEFIKGYSKYGYTDYNGKHIPYGVCDNEKDVMRLNSLKSLKGDIEIEVSQNVLYRLGYILEDKYLTTSKIDTIKQTLQDYYIEIESNKVITLLLKVTSNSNTRNDILAIADACGNFITVKFLQEEYNVDNSKHPVNVLKTLLQHKGFKTVLKHCREIYNDKGIKSTMLDHLNTAVTYKIRKVAGLKTKYNSIGNYGIKDIGRLLFLLNTEESLDVAFLKYRRMYYADKRRIGLY